MADLPSSVWMGLTDPLSMGAAPRLADGKTLTSTLHTLEGGHTFYRLSGVMNAPTAPNPVLPAWLLLTQRGHHPVLQHLAQLPGYTLFPYSLFHISPAPNASICRQEVGSTHSL